MLATIEAVTNATVGQYREGVAKPQTSNENVVKHNSDSTQR
jgi:hypothetical protein